MFWQRPAESKAEGGRRRAASFLQIVPGVFPTGVVTGMFCAFSAENQRGDRKTQTHRPSCTKQPTLKKICANLRNLRIKNVCYQSLIAYQTEKKINQSGAKDTCCQ
jgi:hypothetical protein